METDKDLEKMRGNPNKKNLRVFLDVVREEAAERQKKRLPQFPPEFMKGVDFALGMVRNFFRLGPGGDAKDKKAGAGE